MSSAADDRPLLMRAAGLSKTYGRTRVLDDVSFEVRPGEVHALLGGNGSGKSTMIKALAGVVSFDAGGRIEATGDVTPAANWTPHHARSAHLRFVHQDLALFPELAVVENLALGSGFVRTKWGRVRWRPSRSRADALLRHHGIRATADTLVKDLSLAQCAMLAIARALQDVRSDDAAIIVLDEPTGALPADEAEKLHAALRRLTEMGHAVVLVTHDIEEVLTRCDHVTVFRDGRQIHSGPTAELDREGLIQLIVGRAAPAVAKARRTAHGSEVPALEILSIVGGGLDIRGVDIAPGEVIGVTGMVHAGADKVLQAIFGLRPGTRCDLRVAGAAASATSPRAAMANGVAYLPSDRIRDGAFHGLPVLENLGAASMRHAAPRGLIQHRRERREARELTTSFRVKPADPTRLIGSLSGGNQQKVLLARWARRDPRLLLLDDPTRGVDVGARADIWTLLAEQCRTTGLAILVTSSDPEELAANCHRVLVLGSGRVVAELDGAGLEATHITAACYAAAESKESQS